MQPAATINAAGLPIQATSSRQRCCWSALSCNQQPPSMLLVRSPSAAANMTLQPLPPRVGPTLQPAMFPAASSCQLYCWSAHLSNQQPPSTAGPPTLLQLPAWHCNLSPPRVNPTLHPAMLQTTSSCQQHCWSAKLCCRQHDTAALTSKGEVHSGPDEAAPKAPIKHLCNNGLCLGPPTIPQLARLLSSQTPGFPSPFFILLSFCMPDFSTPMMLLQGCVDRKIMDHGQTA